MESPVLEAPTATTDVRCLVLDAAVRSYEATGEAVTAWKYNGHLRTELLVPRLGRVERVESEDSLGEVDVVEVRGHRARGLEVWMLVPLHKIGEAHGRFRGEVDRLQAWWMGDDLKVHFGEPRIP